MPETKTKVADLALLQKVYEVLGTKFPQEGVASVTIMFTEERKIRLIETRYVAE